MQQASEMQALQEKTCQTEYGTIHYWVSDPPGGAARPWLVFLPGLTADHRLFESQLAEFAPRYRCLAWDAPAHGSSRPFVLHFTMEDYADDLHAILATEGIAKPVLIGQSLGGYVAQVYLDKYPEDAAGFLSIDSCPLQRQYYTGIELFLLKHTLLMYLAIPWKTLLKLGGDGCAETESGRRLMGEMMNAYNKIEYCHLAAHGYRMLAEAVEAGRAYRIPCPMRALCGEKDAAGSAKRYNEQWAKRGGVPLVWVPNAGHNSNTDDPFFVNREIENFVSELSPATR